MGLLLWVITILISIVPINSYRTAFTNKIIKFQAENRTFLNESITFTTDHVVNPITLISLVSLTATPMTSLVNVTTNVVVAQSTYNDTVTIEIKSEAAPEFNFAIQLEFARISNSSSFQLTSLHNVTNTSINSLMYQNGIAVIPMIRGFNSFSSISSLNITKTENDTKYTIESADAITLDLLVFNTTGIFNTICTTSKYYNLEVIDKNQTIDVKSQYQYIYSLYGSFVSCQIVSNNVVATGNCTYAIIQVDTMCLDSFVSTNQMVPMGTWELPVIVVMGGLVLAGCGYLFYYLYVLHRRMELRLGLYQQRDY